MSAREIVRQAAKTTRGVVAAAKLPPLWPPGHYYSPLTTPEDAERAVGWIDTDQDPAGVVIDHEAMRALAAELAPMWGAALPLDGRYRPDVMYAEGDAAIYHSMLRHFRPPRVLEVGSGFSTALALDTIDRHDLRTTVTCVEPNPERLRGLLRPTDEVPLIEGFVQDVPVSRFRELEAGDVLFIDSTHVVKAGSDVAWLVLHVLPHLAPGVLVHIHDMFWPFEYRPEWLRARQDWNEVYLVHAFLSGNAEWKVLLFADLVWQRHRDLVAEYAPTLVGQQPGGLWLRKVA